MKIQLIRYDGTSKQFSDVTVSPLSKPRSLDEFDINVIDLTDKKIWCYSGKSHNLVDIQNDFKSLHTMVEKKNKAIILYVFPRDTTFYCDHFTFSNGSKYMDSTQLKDMIYSLEKNILSAVLPSGSYAPSLVFENTRTTIKGIAYEADFYFDIATNVLTKSDSSGKVTTFQIHKNAVYVTTLAITESKDILVHYLNNLFCEEEKSPVPKWISEVDFADDSIQKVIISDANRTIQEANAKIKKASEQIEENARYKSILYSTGNELVEVVFDILEKLLSCDLSKFVDKKKEDFLIKTARCTFVGEIKGVNSNIKSEHISQVDVHYQGYMDELAEEGASETVHPLLIISRFRSRAVAQRDPIHETQLKLAIRNGCLIIETSVLLCIFERYLTGEITSAKCIEVFSGRTGLLQLSAFEESAEDLACYKV